MSPLEHPWHGHNIIDVKTKHVSSRIFEGVVEGLFILVGLSLAVSHEAITIANEDEDSTLIGPVETCNISYGIRVDENQGEVSGIKQVIRASFKESFDVSTLVLLESCRLRSSIKSMRLSTFLDLIVLQLRYIVPVVLEILSTPELLHHYHVVLAHLRGHLQKLVLLLSLGEVDNIRPALLVFSLKVFKELIEAFVSLSKFLNRLIQTFTRVLFVALNKVLKLFNLRNGSGP